MDITAANQSKPPSKITWFVPRWSVTRELRQLVPYVFGASPVARMIGISLVLAAAICLGVKLAVPQLQLGPILWKAILAIPVIFLYLGFFFLIHYLIPTHVCVSDKYIIRFHGQSGSHIKIDDIQSSKLVVYSPRHIYLYIIAQGKRTRLAVAPTVDLDRLLALVGRTDVVDRQERFTAARALVDAARKATISSRQKKPSLPTN